MELLLGKFIYGDQLVFPFYKFLKEKYIAQYLPFLKNQ
jgi:hypothetical protein